MMRQRLETLRRLVNLYAAVEEMHSTELQRMTAAVHEAKQAIVTEQMWRSQSRDDGREALRSEDRAGWMMSETQQETSVWRRQRLEQIRLEREQSSDEARQQYVASRLKREQMKRSSTRLRGERRWKSAGGRNQPPMIGSWREGDGPMRQRR